MSERHPHDAEDDLHRLADLFARNAPPEPAEDAWARTFASIDRGTPPPRRPSRWWLTGAAGLITAAAVLLAVVYTRWPGPSGPAKPDAVVKLPAGDDNDEPFAVASASEVHVISVDVDDADRLALGRPLLGLFEVATPTEIELVDAEPDEESLETPWLQVGENVPLIMTNRP